MIRTQIQLPEEQVALQKKMAAVQHESMVPRLPHRSSDAAAFSSDHEHRYDRGTVGRRGVYRGGTDECVGRNQTGKPHETAKSTMTGYHVQNINLISWGIIFGIFWKGM